MHYGGTVRILAKLHTKDQLNLRRINTDATTE